MRNRDGVKRFAKWCEDNGVLATMRDHTIYTQVAYYFDAEGMMGIYDVPTEDVPLVKLRWSGDLV
jgi:hypothetical protein